MGSFRKVYSDLSRVHCRASLRNLLCALLLTGPVLAEPEFFPASEPVQGHVMLVAEDGQKEAAALARAGIECLLSHAQTIAELNEDWGTAHIVQDLRTRWELPDSAIGEKSPAVFDRARLLRMLNKDGAL